MQLPALKVADAPPLTAKFVADSALGSTWL
jgi:hypothetical protein